MERKGFATGYGEHYTPVRFKADEQTRLKEFRDVHVTGLEGGEDPNLIAEPIK